MKIFEILKERSVDPVDLAARVGRRYGTQDQDYGYDSSDTVKSKYIPLKSYNDDLVNEMEEELWELFSELGVLELPRGEQQARREKITGEATSTGNVTINKLTATQPFVRIEDVEILKNKVASSKSIKVMKYVNKLFIQDGHHAVLAATLRGEKTIQATIIDLDKLQDKYV